MHDELHPTGGTLSGSRGSNEGFEPPELPTDLYDLVTEVVSQVPRMLALQDRDPDSPMRGCMHPAYWRDKSSDVADLRRQEAALAFAWLWRYPFVGNRFRGDVELLHASLRALRFWTTRQHADGTFDEWYRGEHGYATTAFSSYAVALTVDALDEALANPLRGQVVRALRRAADWLTRHHDWFKTNHEAVGVAALGAVGWLLNEDTYRRAASRHAAHIGQRMHTEGWSREVSGLDVGYTFLLAEYLGMHAVLNGDRELLPSMIKAYRFAADFLHPNLTTGAEYGICGNSYFSRVATVIAAPHDAAAAGALRWMDQPCPTPRDTSATLKDDLRLARYAYQPLLATLLHSGALQRHDTGDGAELEAMVPAPLLFEREDEQRWYPHAKLAAVARPGYAAWFAPCHGGFLRVAFRNGGRFFPAVADRGFAIDHASRTYRNALYSLEPKVDQQRNGMTVTAALVPCQFVMPPYWARVGLRLATSLPGGHRWSRWLIDRWRARNGTALNQSAAGVRAGRSPFRLRREIRFHADRIELTDRLSSRLGTLDPATVCMVLDGPIQLADGRQPDVDRRISIDGLAARSDAADELTLYKEIYLERGRVTVRFLHKGSISPSLCGSTDSCAGQDVP